MSERCSHFLFRSPFRSVDGTHKPISSGQMRSRFSPNHGMGGRRESRRKDHHPLRAHHNSSRSDQINTAGQAGCNTHVIRDCHYRDDLGFTTVILFHLKMWPQEFLPSLLLRRIPERTFMTPCASLSYSLSLDSQLLQRRACESACGEAASYLIISKQRWPSLWLTLGHEEQEWLN